MVLLSTPGDWAGPDLKDADISVPFLDQFDVVLNLQVLHVLSRTQSELLLARLFRCAHPSGILLGSCVGAMRAQDWSTTPDGSAARFLYDADTLRTTLLTAGWAQVTVRAVSRTDARNPTQGDMVQLQFVARRTI